IVGPDRCLFGTERPGAGSKTDPRTGKWYDDVRPNIESISWLSAEDKAKIFERNAVHVFSRFRP
ncbi:MAG: amidohydrolase family protein, partial [Betaproteobacteria bacterium]